MRGKPQAQPDFLTVINLNACVPAEHPLRAIKARVDAVLKKLSPLFDELYAEDGRVSIPPEPLLQARVLTALYRKACGKEARLYLGGHVLMENRPGLCAEFTLHHPITEPESAVALRPIDEHAELHEGVKPATVGADKGYHQKAFVRECRERGISPHVACKAKVQVPGLDGRTTTQSGYQVSQRIRKRVEEIFGWMKTVGGLRRSRYLGLERTQAWGYFVAGTYNLLRLARLEASAAG